jgi:uncharacterized metal-binding protein/predicted Fe-Mo cluster-binding NifX family protein
LAYKLLFIVTGRGKVNMQYGIPLFGNRVAPRCTIADSLMLLAVTRNKVRSQHVVAIEQRTWEELIPLLVQRNVDALVCGGISRLAKESVESKRIDVVDNVAGTAEEIIRALQAGSLHPGFGLQEHPKVMDRDRAETAEQSAISSKEVSAPDRDVAGEASPADRLDCLSCADRVCLRGRKCGFTAAPAADLTTNADRQMLESAMDIACEEDRTLCRLSELIYFCLGMKYKRLGVAFCIDLLEPAEILVGVLRRFFEVYPVCCKVGGIRISDPIMSVRNDAGSSDYQHVICNPLGQAELLNQIGTDINVMVGLCMGVDCVFTKAGKAPVTTLFVKDRSLANNPIGALYSEYYLKEATRSSVATT